MDIINQDRDVLFAIFCRVSSYKRSKIGTVCKLWNEMGLRCISLIEDLCTSSEARFLSEYYHSIIRILIQNKPIVDDGSTYSKTRQQTYKFYMRELRQHMCTNGKLHFPKLHFTICKESGCCIDKLGYITAVGHDKLFYWMLANNARSDLTLNDYREAAIYLGYNTGDANLVTAHNAPRGVESIAQDFNDYGMSREVFNKVMSFNKNITIWKVFKECLYDKDECWNSCRISSQLINIILCDVQMMELEEINDYYKFQAHYHPNLCVFDVIKSTNQIYDRRNPNVFIDKRVINLCRNGSMTAKAYKKFKFMEWPRNLSVYYGIIASGYNYDVMNILCYNRWRYAVHWLELAYRYKHKKMIYLLIDYIQNELAKELPTSNECKTYDVSEDDSD